MQCVVWFKKGETTFEAWTFYNRQLSATRDQAVNGKVRDRLRFRTDEHQCYVSSHS